MVAFYMGQDSSAPEPLSELSAAKPLSELSAPRPRKKRIAPLPRLELNVPVAEHLNESLREIIDAQSALSFRQRNGLVGGLRQQHLSDDDLWALMAFLKKNPKGEGAQLSWHSLKNDLLKLLIDDGRLQEATGQLMVEIINDADQHPVMREYVLQFTRDYFERHWLLKSPQGMTEKQDLSAFERQIQQAMLDSMWKALDSSHSEMTATSLVRLQELSKNFAVIDQQRLEAAVKDVLQDTSSADIVRMAAFSIAGARGSSDLKELTTEVVFDENNSVLVRMAALHTASVMGTDQDYKEKLTTEFINNEQVDKRLQRAAKLALLKLNK